MGPVLCFLISGITHASSCVCGSLYVDEYFLPLQYIRGEPSLVLDYMDEKLSSRVHI